MRTEGRRLAASGALPTIAIVGVLTVIGAVLRLLVAGQSLFADELATYWIVTEHGLGGVLSTVHSNAEITPPLSFVLSWLTAHVSHAPELIRAPSVIAGAATIPVAYLIGVRTLGRRAAVLGAAVLALSPFMVYYSAEARAYSVMMFFTALSTLALLLAVDQRRARWWVLYGVASCAAAYSHYTCVFVLLAQFAWAAWTHPHARRPLLLANAGAVVGFLPFITGFHNDLTSPTSAILAKLSPFTFRDIRIAVGRWALGSPYSGLNEVPGIPALVLVGGALLLGLAGLARRLPSRLRDIPDRVVLLGLLAVAAPVGELIAGALGTELLSSRNLAASWPALGLVAAALVLAAPRRAGMAAGALLVVGLALGTVALNAPKNRRPDYQAVAEYVQRHAGPRAAIIDATGALSPGPFTGLDATLPAGRIVIRAAAPAERDHPFTVFDRIQRIEEASILARRAAPGAQIFLVDTTIPTDEGFALRRQAIESGLSLPGYRKTATARWRGVLDTSVEVYTRTGR